MAPFLFYTNFLDYLKSEKRFSENTVIAYLKDLDQFFDYCPIVKRDEFSELTPRIIRGWIVYLVEQDYTPKSISRKLASLRTYFRVLVRLGVMQNNPAKYVRGPKIEKRLPSFVDEVNGEVGEILQDWSYRDGLIVEILYQTGMRLSELVNIETSDVNNNGIRVLGKGAKERVIPISQALVNAIDEYRNSLSEEFATNTSLILTDSGRKLYPKFVYRKINYYLSNVANVQKKSPHVLRHTFATHMLNNGAGLEVIKELLGHANLSATQVYTHNSFAKLNSIYSQAHPRGRKNKE